MIFFPFFLDLEHQARMPFFSFFTNDQCRMTNDCCLKGFLVAEGNVDGKFSGLKTFDFSFFLCYLFLSIPGGGL